MMWRRMVFACLIACLIPYVATLAWTGTMGLMGGGVKPAGERLVLMDESGGELGVEAMDLEEYLIGVVAGQIQPDDGVEAVKAQAILERTYLYKKMEGQPQAAESTLGTKYQSPSQTEEQWGSELFSRQYGHLEEAVAATRGEVLQSDGEYIDPLFHEVSAGMTRNGGPTHPYLQSVPCPLDVEAEGYMQICVWTPEEFSGLLSPCLGSQSANEGQMEAILPEQVSVTKTDAAGYVQEISLSISRGEGQEPEVQTLDGEAVADALGLKSTNFVLEGYEGRIRAVCLGEGHGYGLCRYGAGRMAQEGKKAEEILRYYYKNIVLTTE